MSAQDYSPEGREHPVDGFYADEIVRWDDAGGTFRYRHMVCYASPYRIGAWIADCSSHRQAQLLAAALNATLNLRGQL